MAAQVMELKCPGCGARVDVGQTSCEWCHKPITVSSFNSIYAMTMPQVNKYAGAYKKALQDEPDDIELNSSIAMCYLKLKLYDKALLAFEKAMEDNFENSETFFYAAVCLLRGKKAFLASRKDIDTALEYTNAALMIEQRGLYYYFLAYIKYDYFERKYLNVSPNYRECYITACQIGTSEYDIHMLYDVLGVERPNIL